MLVPSEPHVADALIVLAVGVVALWFSFKHLRAAVRDLYNGVMEIPRAIVQAFKDALRRPK